MPYEGQLIQPTVNEENSDGIDILGFLRRRKSFIILFAFIGIAVSYLMLNRAIPQYRSDAWVQVIHRSAEPMLQSMIAEKDLTDVDYVMKSPKTLVAAYKNHGLGTLGILSGLSEDDAVARISAMITTKNLSANVVQVSVTGMDPSAIREIAKAASEEYVLAQRANYKDATEELKEILSKARDEFLTMLKSAEEEYRKFRSTSSLTTDGENPHRTRAKAAHEKVSELELKLTELRAELSQLEEAVKKGNSREAILLLIGKNVSENRSAPGVVSATESKDPDEVNLATAILPLLVQRAELSATVGPDHPKLKQLDTQIQMTRQHFKELAGLSKTPEEQKNVEEPTDILEIYLQSLREELSITEKQQRDLKILADNEDLKARQLMQEEIEDNNRKNEIARLSKLFDETTLQISQVQVNAGMGGVTAQVLSPARHGVLIYPIMTKFLSMGAFFGAFAGLALGFLVEIADRSFRKPEDIIREFGMPILGHIPFMTEKRLGAVPSDSLLDRTAVSVHLPRSRPAEAYRAVRTAICFSALGSSQRVIQVTSPAAGDGKSTLALNLALSMAQSGKRTILIESDFRRPKVHKLTGVENKNGLVDLLRGDCDFDAAIKHTAVPDFFVMPCGSRPKDPAELLARARYDEVLESLRQQFEYVIIDTPPVMAVTDPCGVAARVDGVLICIRLTRHTRELGKRTLEQLRDVGATIVGIVVNGVEERDGYGYGSYRYSDYRYHYKSYNYKYGYGNYSSKYGSEYYTDEHTPENIGSGKSNTVGETKPS